LIGLDFCDMFGTICDVFGCRGAQRKMLSRLEFQAELVDAYAHLYDLVYLRTHPLVELLVSGTNLRRKEKAWRLHGVLTGVIDELDPGPNAPAFSREWRRHRLMVLRYVDGIDPQAVADELSISRRHFYREHEAALEAVAGILWDRHMAGMGDEMRSPTAGREDPVGEDRLALLRMEAARLNQATRYVRLAEVVGGTIRLVQEMAGHKQIRLRTYLAEDSILVGVDRNTLRQVVLGLLSYLVERVPAGEIEIRESHDDAAVQLTLQAQWPAACGEFVRDALASKRFPMLSELARMQQSAVRPFAGPGATVGFEIRLPLMPLRTVLVVDDNEDVLLLFQRYLSPHRFQVTGARSGANVLEMASLLQPYAIILDLMLPEMDGWEVLQALVNRPQTQRIPVIICTILAARQLALSLGAAAFLEKPVTEEALLAALNALDDMTQPDRTATRPSRELPTRRE
jgi:CheY-like chemotaxis protein